MYGQPFKCIGASLLILFYYLIALGPKRINFKIVCNDIL